MLWEQALTSEAALYYVFAVYWPESGEGLLTGCLWCCCTAVWLLRAELVTCALLAGLGTGALVSSIWRNFASILRVYSAGGSSSSWFPGSPDRTTSRSYAATLRSDSSMPRASSSRGGVILRIGFRSGGAPSSSYCLNLETIPEQVYLNITTHTSWTGSRLGWGFPFKLKWLFFVFFLPPAFPRTGKVLFSKACVCSQGGGGTPILGWERYPPHSAWWGYTPSTLPRGYPIQPTRGGGVIPSNQQGEYSHLKIREGVSSSEDEGTPRMDGDTPPPHQDG